jgi:hypothetical protein
VGTGQRVGTSTLSTARQFSAVGPMSRSHLRCGGRGYLVIGAQPGRLNGTTAHDATKIEDWLARYVGRSPDAPEWPSVYVEITSKPVVVIYCRTAKDGPSYVAVPGQP